MWRWIAALSGVVIAAALVQARSDVIRYARISRVGTHPESVPAVGRKAYPQSARDATPDGTGEFDSARRGGPRHPELPDAD